MIDTVRVGRRIVPLRNPVPLEYEETLRILRFLLGSDTEITKRVD